MYPKITAQRSPTRCTATNSTQYEVRICTNKVCFRQGAKQILQFGKDLALPGIEVTDCGCLGSCGAGPNIAVLPLREPSSLPFLLHHMTTPAKLAEAFRDVCGAQIDETVLKCTELRLAGNSAARDNKLDRAIELYSQGIALEPHHGLHLLLANRSVARLSSGQAEKALEDAVAAVECCPPEFTTSGVRHADALFALGRYKESLAALRAAAERHPPYSRTQEFKDLEKAIKRSVVDGEKEGVVFI